MSRRSRLLSALAAISLGFTAGRSVHASPPPLVLGRQQALELGLGASLSLRSQVLTVEENQALVGLARSRFLPRLELVALGTFAQVDSDIGFISNLPTIGDLNLNLGANSSALINNAFVNLGVIMTMPLLDFGRGPLQQAAQADLQAARAQEQEQQRRTRFEILNRYFSAQLSAAQIPVWESSLAISQRLLRDVNAIRRVGLAPRIDTFQAEALQQADLQGLAEAQAQQEIALSGLARVLNFPAETRVKAGDPLQKDPAWSYSLSDSINQALEQRPSLESLIQLQLAQRAKIQLARAGRLPSVGLLVGAGVSGNWLDIPNQNVNSSISASNGTNVALPTISTSGSASGSFTDWGAAITVRQPLYDGGFTRESIALAERRAAQAEITIQQAQQAIIQSVETFFATHQAAAPQITAARAAIVAGERSVQDGLLRYRAGLSPLTELLVAQRNLQIARSAEANAIYRWNLSRAALELETGFVR